MSRGKNIFARVFSSSCASLLGCLLAPSRFANFTGPRDEFGGLTWGFARDEHRLWTRVREDSGFLEMARLILTYHCPQGFAWVCHGLIEILSKVESQSNVSK